jgi:hypothetical protein
MFFSPVSSVSVQLNKCSLEGIISTVYCKTPGQEDIGGDRLGTVPDPTGPCTFFPACYNVSRIAWKVKIKRWTWLALVPCLLAAPASRDHPGWEVCAGGEVGLRDGAPAH